MQWNPFIMLTRSEKLFSVKLVFGVFGICFVYDFLRTKKLIFFGFFILKRAFSEQSSEVFIDQWKLYDRFNGLLVGSVEKEFSFFENICQRAFGPSCVMGLVSKSKPIGFRRRFGSFSEEHLSHTRCRMVEWGFRGKHLRLIVFVKETR